MRETTTGRTLGLRLAVLTGFAVLVAARLPGLWPDGRLWAEEGVVYLARAWRAPWPDALFTVHTGYLNLPASLAATLALHLVPLEHAPQITVLLSFALQLLPAVLLASSGIAWLQDWRVLGAALLWLAVLPLADEVWLNSITSQFHVTLAVAILLAAPVCRGRARWLHRAVLLLAPLCGPVAGTLLPLFALRAWLDCSRGRACQAALLLPALLVQLVVMLLHPEPMRSVAPFDLPMVLAAITGKQILLPLLGPTVANHLMMGVAAVFAAGRWQVAAMLAPMLWFGVGAWVARRSRDAATRWLFVGGVAVMAISYAGALTPAGSRQLLILGFGLRYYFVPAALFGLAGFGAAAAGRAPERRLAGLLMAWLLLVGVAYFRLPQALMAHGPDWRQQVAEWRENPAHPLAIWPAGWVVRLPGGPPAP